MLLIVLIYSAEVEGDDHQEDNVVQAKNNLWVEALGHFEHERHFGNFALIIMDFIGCNPKLY
jgi:hypothetical protein